MQDDAGRVLKGYGSNLIEMEASRDDSYETLSRAADALHIGSTRTKMCLYKPSTVCIGNMELTVKSVKKKWTLGNYLLAVKKSPAQIKFGVGYLQGEEGEDVKHVCTCMYYHV